MKGALYALGSLAFVGGLGWTVLTYYAASMSDNPHSGDSSFYTGLGITGVGVALLVGGYFAN